jgi:hypothetical protein
MDDFCALSRYTPKDVDTDAKRKEKFLSGLKGELKNTPVSGICSKLSVST